MNISQDQFNKIVTMAMLLFTMVMIVWSFASDKTLDPSLFLALIPPSIVHGTHLLSNKIPDRNGNDGHQ